MAKTSAGKAANQLHQLVHIVSTVLTSQNCQQSPNAQKTADQEIQDCL